MSLMVAVDKSGVVVAVDLLARLADLLDDEEATTPRLSRRRSNRRSSHRGTRPELSGPLGERPGGELRIVIQMDHGLASCGFTLRDGHLEFEVSAAVGLC
jgi:hypothetical protein